MLLMEDVSFRYAHGSDASGVSHIDLRVEPGEVVLVCGPSGCGKTTVARLANGLAPHYYEGEIEGAVTACGLDVARAELHETARAVGSVFQNPKSQFFTTEVGSELAFGCENQGVPEPEILDAVARTVGAFGIERLSGRAVSSLSGGEKQKVACAAASVPDPPVMVLDEPSSNLDAEAVRDIARIVAGWKREGRAVLVAEHRVHYLADLVDRVYLMREGRVERVLSGDGFRALSPAEVRGMGLRPLRLGAPAAAVAAAARRPTAGTVEFEGLAMSRGRGKGRRRTLDVARLSVPQGSTVAVIGRNGAGKTTFARCLTGLEKRCEGTVSVGGRALGRKGRLSSCYLVMQDVNHQLFTESVLDEVLLSMPDEDEGGALGILEGLDLAQRAQDHPLSLSGGQKQRVAIASAVASERDVIVFDEPTSGLDLLHMEEVAACMADIAQAGRTQFVVTHDPELILECCDRVLHLEAGRVAGFYELDAEGAERMLAFFRSFFPES